MWILEQIIEVVLARSLSSNVNSLFVYFMLKSITGEHVKSTGAINHYDITTLDVNGEKYQIMKISQSI